MVLISGNNRSVSQANDERSKAQGVNVLHNSHQQGNKSVDSGRTQSLSNTNLTKGMTTPDEFKYGFPSEGLSSTASKWWGSCDHDDSPRTNSNRGKSQPEEREGEAEKAASETGNTESSETPKGATLLKSVRTRAAEEGREAFRMGVFRGYGGVNKLGKRENILLRRIFRSSLPRSWIPDL